MKLLAPSVRFCDLGSVLRLMRERKESLPWFRWLKRKTEAKSERDEGTRANKTA